MYITAMQCILPRHNTYYDIEMISALLLHCELGYSHSGSLIKGFDAPPVTSEKLLH